MSTLTILEVQGMTCGSCVRHIQAALAPLEVDSVTVDLRQGRVTVQHDAEDAPEASLIEAIERAGYPAQRAR